MTDETYVYLMSIMLHVGIGMTIVTGVCVLFIVAFYALCRLEDALFKQWRLVHIFIQFIFNRKEFMEWKARQGRKNNEPK